MSDALEKKAATFTSNLWPMTAGWKLAAKLEISEFLTSKHAYSDGK